MKRAGVAVGDDEFDIDGPLSTDADIVEVEPSSDPVTRPPDSPLSPADTEQLSVFRDFINSLDLDDFDRRHNS